jgi:hypothetical protein
LSSLGFGHPSFSRGHRHFLHRHLPSHCVASYRSTVSHARVHAHIQYTNIHPGLWSLLCLVTNSPSTVPAWWCRKTWSLTPKPIDEDLPCYSPSTTFNYTLPRNETRRVPSRPVLSCTSLWAAFCCLTNICHCVVTDSSPLPLLSAFLVWLIIFVISCSWLFPSSSLLHTPNILVLSSPPRGCRLLNLLLWSPRPCSCAGPKYLVAVASLSDICRLTNTWLPVRSNSIQLSIGPVTRSAAYASTSLGTLATCSTRLPTSKLAT